MPRHFTADELALLAGIHADPRSDLPRLVYADWLDDHGEADRAELIRLECDQRGQGDLRRRVDELWRQLGKLQPPSFAPQAMFYGFSRGLPVYWLCERDVDPDRIVRLAPPDACLRLNLHFTSPQIRHQALCHHVMEQVHEVGMHRIDEYDALALAETACSFRPVTIWAEIVAPGALPAFKRFLPQVRLRRQPIAQALLERKVRITPRPSVYDFNQTMMR